MTSTLPAAGRLAGRRVYLCTPDRPDVASFVDACIRGGVDVVQLRDKTLDARPLLDRAAIVRQVCHDHGVPFILNDRPDLALDAGADGVHVGQDDAPPALARRILGPDAIVGLSTHAPGRPRRRGRRAGRLPLRRPGRADADQARPAGHRDGLRGDGDRPARRARCS